MSLKNLSSLSRRAALPFALLAIFVPRTLRAQGPLAPPAEPAPTMKTLTQVEPRIAIPAGGAFVISTPGSYYLSGNIDVSVTDGNAITIQADNVTLDLNGFTITGSTAAATLGIGVAIAGNKHVTLRNGNLVGFSFGIYLVSPKATADFRMEKLTISGCLRSGIKVPATISGGVIDHCTFSSIGTAASTVLNAGVDCFGGVAIQDCTIDGVTSGSIPSSGLDMGVGSVALRNVIRNCKTGIRGGAYANNYAHNCTTAFVPGTDGGGNFSTP